MNELPKCPKCTKAPLLPLSDYGEGGGSVKYKAWCCADIKCGYAVRIDKGKLSYETVRNSH
jgi:hypothetical protein